MSRQFVITNPSWTDVNLKYKKNDWNFVEIESFFYHYFLSFSY